MKPEMFKEAVTEYQTNQKSTVEGLEIKIKELPQGNEKLNNESEKKMFREIKKILPKKTNEASGNEQQ